MLGLIQDWPLRLHRIVDYAACQFGDRDIVSRQGDGSSIRTSYTELRVQALRVAQRLRDDGIQPGDRVSTMAWNSARHLEAWFGITGLGAVYHTVNPRLFPEQIAWIINHAGARAIFIEPMFLPLLERLLDRVPSLERVVVLGDVPALSTALPGLIGFDDWLSETSQEGNWTGGDEREAAGLCYTSGTTGDPKGVLYSHRSTLLHALAISGANCMALSARDTVMPIVPMFHVNAWGLPFAAAMTGARLIMPGAKLDGESLFGMMEAEGVTLAAGVPTIWSGLLDHLRRRGLRLSTLKRLFVGGSACPRSMIEAYEADYGIEVCHAWGMTETSPVGTVGSLKASSGLADKERYDLKAKQGFAPFGIEMKISDDEGRCQPLDGRSFGRLAVRGWAVASAYYNDDAPILDDEGFFDTGDVATIDAQGYMQIVDRNKDVIKSGGEWISSIAIENIAVAHPNVAEAAVIGIPHAKWGERPVLIIVGREGKAPAKEELIRFLTGKIPVWWTPDDVIATDELPHTATGKISKLKLRELYPAAAPTIAD